MPGRVAFRSDVCRRVGANGDSISTHLKSEDGDSC